jgi:adenylate kinase
MNFNYKVIFITGSPGVGKTTVANEIIKKLSKKYESQLFKINKIVIDNELTLGIDKDKGYKIVDIDKLDKKLIKILNNDKKHFYSNISNKFSNIGANSNKLKNIKWNHDKNDHPIDKSIKIAVVEGHLSHLCSECDKLIVLRLNPNILKKRLQKRNYSESKVQENLESEALAICSHEAYQIHKNKVNEVDTTNLSIVDVVDICIMIIEDKSVYHVGEIDFMDWFLK